MIRSCCKVRPQGSRQGTGGNAEGGVWPRPQSVRGSLMLWKVHSHAGLPLSICPWANGPVPRGLGPPPSLPEKNGPCLESLRAPRSRVNGARAGRERDSGAEAEGAAAREGDRHLWRVHPTREAASARGWEPWRAGAAPLRPDQAAPLGWCGPHGPSVPPLPWSCPGVAAVSMVLGVMSPSMPLLPSIPPATPGKGGSETRGFWA